MPTFQGQSDQVVPLKLKSYLVLARWLETRIALNGSAGIEVLTAYVGNGAKVKVTLRDGEGGTIVTLNGVIQSNLFRARHQVTQAPKGGKLTFEVELPDHSLKKTSGELLVTTPLNIRDLVWQNPEGQTLKEAVSGEQGVLKAKVIGEHTGMARLQFYCRPKPGEASGGHDHGATSEHLAGQYDVPIDSQGVVQVRCQLGHASHPANRRDNLLRFKVLCDGYESEWSADLPFTAIPDFHFSR